MADRITDADVAHAMSTYGGSFVQALAQAWLRGDPVNRDRIRVAFPEYWTQYHELIALRRQREATA